MTRSFAIRRTSARLAAGLAAALFIAFAPIIAGALAPAQAQVAVKAEFRTALEPHGTWRNSSKWGDVWVPANRPRNWQPYTVGHWVYTDDWGWYWIEDQAEAAWGVVAFHYGRWVMEEDVWVWVPGEEWGPGWVAWRHSNKRGSEGRRDSRAEATYVGWAAMPPDEMVEEIWEEPRVWVFVRSRDFTAPVVARVILPLPERQVAIRETVVINRTVLVREQRFAVNPGIPPVLIAAEIGRPLRSYEVRPVVLTGTVRLPGALEVRADELRSARSDRVRVTARETRTEFRPSNRLPEIQPLRPGEQGRYFDNPPRAVQRVQQGPQPTRGQGQPDQQQGQQQRDQQQQGQQGRDAGQPKQGTQGRGAPDEQRQQQGREGQGTDQKARQQQGRDQGKGRDAEQTRQGQRKDQGRGSDEQRPGTEGRGTDDQRQQGREGGAAKQQQKKDQSKQQQKDQGRDGQSPQGTQGRGTDEQRQQRDRRDGDQQRVPQGTQGRGSDEQRQQDDRQSGRASDRAKANASDRAKPKEPQDPGRNDQRRNAAEPKGAPQGTQGRGAGEQRQHESAQPRPLPQSGTEGRGGSQFKGESRGVPKQPPQATEGRGGAPGGGGQPAGER